MGGSSEGEGRMVREAGRTVGGYVGMYVMCCGRYYEENGEGKVGGEGEEKMEERGGKMGKHVLYLKRHQLQDGEGWVERKGVGEREKERINGGENWRG